MRKIIVLVLVGLLGSGAWLGVYPATVQAADPYAFSDGDGSLADPYVVLTAEDLDHVRDDLDAYYVQGADIDLSDYATGTGWIPIGTESDPFTGSYDGNYYTIEGLFINSLDNRIGLFGNVDGATLTQTRLENANVTGGYFVGGLAGFASSTRITYSSASGSVTGIDSVGGLIGVIVFAGATIQDSYAAVSVSGDITVGGLVSTIDVGTDGIVRSYASGNVSGNYNIGGLVGTSFGNILNSYATGNVHLTNNSYIGGIVANLQGNLDNSFRAGTFTGDGSLMAASLISRLNSPGLITDTFYNTSSGKPAVRTNDPRFGLSRLGRYRNENKNGIRSGVGLYDGMGN